MVHDCINCGLRVIFGCFRRLWCRVWSCDRRRRRRWGLPILSCGRLRRRNSRGICSASLLMRFFRLHSFVPFCWLYFFGLARDVGMTLFIFSDFGRDVLAISRIQTSHQLRDQVIVLGRFLDSWQLGTCDLSLARSRRDTTVGETAQTTIRLSLEVLLDLFLQQAQVQLLQRIRIQAMGIVGRIIANQRYVLQVVADCRKAEGSIGVLSQSLEQKKLLKRGVRGQARHEVGSRATVVRGDGSQISE